MRLAGSFGKTDAGSGVALGIAIKQERALLRESNRGSQVNGRRGLSDATLLIRNCDDSTQIISPWLRNLSQRAQSMQIVSRGTRFEMLDKMQVPAIFV